MNPRRQEVASSTSLVQSQYGAGFRGALQGYGMGAKLEEMGV
jgi:hypothetical protein